MWGVEAALVTRKALLEVTSEPALTGARLLTMRTKDWQVAVFLVLEELRLAGKDAPAAVTPEVVTLVVRFQCGNIWGVEVAPYLQAVPMSYEVGQHI